MPFLIDRILPVCYNKISLYTGGLKMKTSNYDLMRDKMEKEFLKYDQTEMIKKFALRHNEDYIYISFVSCEYRLNRLTGRVEYVSPRGDIIHADYNISMTVFDVLAYSKPGCRPAGRFAPINSLKGVVHASAPSDNDFFQKTGDFFAGKCPRLKAACEALGGVAETVGDVSYKLPLFDFLPIIFQFWDADDEFGASIRLMWDENILDYMHYETTYFAASHLLGRIKELC